MNAIDNARQFGHHDHYVNCKAFMGKIKLMHIWVPFKEFAEEHADFLTKDLEGF